MPVAGRLGNNREARSGGKPRTVRSALAVGWGAGQLKVGSCARSERTAKWNEALRIEAMLGEAASLARLPVRIASAAIPEK